MLRLVGGKISKTHPITIATPSSTIGIRGGITILDVTPNQTTSTFVFGTNMTVTAAGLTQNVTRPGSQVLTTAGSQPGQPILVPQGALNAQLSLLEGRNTGRSSGSGSNADQAAQHSGFSATNSGQRVTVVGLRPRDNLGSGPSHGKQNPNEVATTALTNAHNTAPSQQPQQPQQSSPSHHQQQPPFLIDNPFNIAGASLTTVNQLNNLALQRATATYTGQMVGVVNNHGHQSIGHGTYQNVWHFGTRSGIATTKFDGGTYGGGNSPNTFGSRNSPVFSTSGPLHSTSGPSRSLDLTGAFLSKPGHPASNQVGVFSITGQNYKAAGAFGAQK